MNNPSSPDHAPQPESQKLSFTTKLAYGAGDLGAAITANILAFFLLFFFTNVAGLNPGLAGSILMISKIWDAVNDPIVGMLSDRTESRWGRRLPWMLWGAIPFGIFFFLQWVVPHFSDNPNVNQWGLFWYYVAISIFFNTAYTAVNLPYTALTPELTQDYNERTSLNSFRFTFSIGGSILSLIIAQVIFAVIKSDTAQQTAGSCNSNSLQYLVLGAVCAIVSVLPLYWCVYGIRRRVMASEQRRLDNTDPSDTLSFSEQLKIAFSNRPFVYVIGIYFCSWLAVQITASIIPYFVINWMKLGEGAFIQVTLAVQGTALLMLYVWNWVCERVGKKAVYFMGMGVWIIAQAGLFFLQPGQVGLMYVLAVMAGVGVSTAYLIPWSMVPDVIELDELTTGQRREGVFYAFMVLLQKMGLAVGLFLLGQGLAVAGFKERIPCQPLPQQPESALTAIRVAIGPLPTIALILGLVLAYFYPITREVHAEILLKLRERKQARTQTGSSEN
ncbi:MAG: MFS transporter [Scytolyngbya sp. HA4215-MV1]|jgi:GPH family glycoside/pentoside/hexuronide:cation symporter|nr:MFS transporter [Scytolyngbya sp. HA4215-MV1]